MSPRLFRDKLSHRAASKTAILSPHIVFMLSGRSLCKPATYSLGKFPETWTALIDESQGASSLCCLAGRDQPS